MCQYLHIIISEKAISSRKSLRESKCVNATVCSERKKTRVPIRVEVVANYCLIIFENSFHSASGWRGQISLYILILAHYIRNCEFSLFSLFLQKCSFHHAIFCLSFVTREHKNFSSTLAKCKGCKLQ